jgi:hypothetical protein
VGDYEISTKMYFLYIPELAGKRPLVVIGPDMGLQVGGLPEGLPAFVLQRAGVKPMK